MAKDRYHDIVKEGLEKEGWIITHNPLIINTGSRNLDIDLGAEKIIAAERENEKIAVETKSFIGHSTLHEFYKAVGQYIYYRKAVERNMPERKLFLALPSDTYNNFILKDNFNFDFINDLKLDLFVYSVTKSIIEKWIKH